MAGRKTIFANQEYYHIYNRGIAKQPVFFNKKDYERFLLALSFYRFANPPLKLSRLLQLAKSIREPLLQKMSNRGEKLVEIICFALMPNHFHLLLQQIKEHGISIFLSKSVNSYTRYVNTKLERQGDLFQGVFKALHLETDEQLLHLSRYIHLNPVVSYLVKESALSDYPWSSFPDYLRGQPSFLKLEPVLFQFPSPKDYQKFVFDQIDYAKKLEEIKHLLLE